ncbi:glutamine--fructose-6-phosphate transaminase (isomerizing) [Halobacteriales archaeon SW_7_65_23]|nr:MAG: glutamine--fructose-6-phosphate transaminase (isomerizing) [Halobacteriales archaeon SW_7_65_23]
MCGIIGYIGSEDALPIVQEGLQNLDYRGYDSAGVALNNGSIEVYKREGKIENLLDVVPEASDADCGIGHTRWSTHGPPTDANAHPHTDCNDRVAVVHNGIIENYEDLKTELWGHNFTSQTDTEVIPHLLEEQLEAGDDPVEAVEAVTDRLEGSYAFVATVTDSDAVLAAREDSPLVIGHADDGHYLASDVTAFLEHTREVSYVEDGDLAVLTDDDVKIHRNGSVVDPDIEAIEWDAEAAEKGGYDHYMLKEIHEQPQSLRQTISGRLDADAGDVELDVDIPEEYLQSLEEIQFVACGTSYYAGEYAARLVEDLADVRATVTLASEYEFDAGRDPWRTLAVAVTQSGETADTLSAIRKADGAGARTLAVTNTLGSTVTREVDDTVFIRAGPEIGVAATKTFASQVATLAMLISGSEAFFFVGRDLGYPVALEGALKLKEISYDHAEGFASGELKHGPLALVTGNTPVLAVLTEGARPEKTLNNVKEVQARDAPVIAASSMDEEKFVDESFGVPSVGVFEPLVANVYWQLFAYHVADLKDRPIDKPRNLAKSVTVE